MQPFSDRKPPGVGRGRGRGSQDAAGGRQAKGIGRGLDEGGAKGQGGSRGRGGPGGKPGGNRGQSLLSLFQNALIALHVYQLFICWLLSLNFVMKEFKVVLAIMLLFSSR